MCSLEDPAGELLVVLDDSFGEPPTWAEISVWKRDDERETALQLDLLLSVLDRVGSVADVAANSQGVVTTDRAWVSMINITVARMKCSRKITDLERRQGGWWRRA